MPQALVAHETDISDFADKCRNLCMQVLRLFALGLKVCSKGHASTGAIADVVVRSILGKAERIGLLNVMMYPKARQAASCAFCECGIEKVLQRQRSLRLAVPST